MVYSWLEGVTACYRAYAHRFISAPEFEPHVYDIFGTQKWCEGKVPSGQARVDFLRRFAFTQRDAEYLRKRKLYSRDLLIRISHQINAQLDRCHMENNSATYASCRFKAALTASLATCKPTPALFTASATK